MTTKYRQRAQQHYAFGASQATYDRQDEERFAREHSRADQVDALNEIISEQRREIERLMAQVAELRSRQTHKPVRKSSAARGRKQAAPVVIYNRITYYSYAKVAELAGLNQSNVSRQVAKLGIKTELIGGGLYIPQAQASNIKRRK